MRYRERERHQARESRVSDLAAAEGGALMAPTNPVPAGRPHRRWGRLLMCAAALGLAWVWRSGTDTMPPDALAPEWTIGLTSSGTAPVSALVVGKEAGIHLVRLPGTDAPEAEQRRVVARLARGNVYMLSLGIRGLRVSSKGPPGSGVVAMGATGRFVKLYQRPDATGISTGWW